MPLETQMNRSALIGCCLPLLLSMAIADEPVNRQPDARTVALYKKLCEQRRKYVLKWAQGDAKEQTVNARDIKRTPIGSRNVLGDGCFVSFASEAERNRHWRTALADAGSAKEVVARFRDKNRPVWAATDSMEPDEFTEVNERLKLGMICNMSSPKCRIEKVVDSDISVIHVNWFEAFEGGEVKARTTKILLCLPPPRS